MTRTLNRLARRAPAAVAATAVTTLSAAFLLQASNGYDPAANSNINKVTPTNTLGLWTANGTNVLEYLPGQLSAGGNPATPPPMMLNSGVFGAPQGLTFDAAGNLWVMDPSGVVKGKATPALFEFSAAQVAQLKTSGSPEPIATITSTALNFPQQSMFDVYGNQWVSDRNNNTVLVFTTAQLAMKGTNNLNPAMVIRSAALTRPEYLASRSLATPSSP
jgi:hypothetical protein